MDIYDIIERMRERPSLYIGEKKVSLLKSFLDGYRACEMDNGYFGRENYELFPLAFSAFDDFVCYKLKRYAYENWKSMILKRCDGNERRGFDLFYSYFDEFKNLYMIHGWRIQLLDYNIEWNDSMLHGYRKSVTGEVKPVFDNPLSVCVVETNCRAYIILVETSEDICSAGLFIPSAKEALITAEKYFGRLRGWNEFPENMHNIEFGKPVRI